ncbi:MFS transporter [Streptomyces inusitatus]|uniref:MFS transporter n=1 Tax=Streptomyces inusitatus TaxID=68221 RepID=A0A918PLW5_9ACTN|nr:MFS transporter [Streptomyces inusitatus]GGZ15089.1 MFS transporter [Streptomyces inusitatus]
MRRVTWPQLLLLGASFLITLGSFAVLPFMSVLLHERWGFGLGLTGLVLAVASLVQFSGGVVGAALAARIGLRATMLVALGIRTAGFACFVPGMDRPALAVAALFLVSTGAALYLPANKAYLVAGCPAERRPGLLAASGSAFNAGMALGPLAAAPFVLGSTAGLFTAVAALFAAVGIAHLALPGVADAPAAPVAPAEPKAEAEPETRGAAGARLLPPFAYTLLSVYVFMFFQHYIALFAVGRTSTAYYAVLLTGYSLVIVAAQPLLAGWIAGLRYARALRLGFGAMAIGMLAIATGGPVGIAAGVLTLGLVETVLFLRNDLEALDRSREPAATVFGRQRLAAGIGAFAAALLGGPLYAAAEDAGSASGFWLAVGAQSLLLPVLLWAGVVWLARRRAAAGPRSEQLSYESVGGGGGGGRC